VIRSHEAGTLRADHVGQTVTLAGWVARRRDHGGVAFIDLRDASGVVQVVIRHEQLAHAQLESERVDVSAPADSDAAEVTHGLRPESCVRIVGEVRRRPEGNENPQLPTGDVEVVASEVEVLSMADPLPFPIEERQQTPVNEENRLRYRYLDLRRREMASLLRMRSRVNHLIREVLDQHGFIDVETPYLTRSTPEGARDFLVPVRLQPGTWYALPQSPQLFKQLLMVAGLERYYQIARCFRDEDFRADRQPEFTQLDIEMSFCSAEDVMELTEQVLSRIWKDILGHEIPTPIRRMTYAEAMRRFGTDRPDLRFGCELVDFTEYFANTQFRVFRAPSDGGGESGWHVGAVVMPGGASQTRKQLDGWQEWARSHGAKGLAYVLVGEDGQLGGPVARNLSDDERAGLAQHAGAKPGDCVFFAAGPRSEALGLLAAARLEIGERCGLIDRSRWEFCWVVDAPMFERVETERGAGWTPVHHPFTAPTPEWVDRFDVEPENALSQAYDIVLNGTELGGGSIRIHRADVQRRVFDVIGLSPEDASRQFGFLLEAFRFGPPPHGGIALGLDRLCALLAGVESIRDVIAFPKTASGSDPLTGAPTPISPAQRREAGVDAVPEKA
jgi:aspartyl-tRNA synthetase